MTSLKFPTEFPRSQRSLEFWKNYKANEFKHFLFFSFLFLKNFIPNIYFNHFFKYVIFIRLLCQDKIDEKDIFLSLYLIKNFIKDFELLYGRENLTYNLHCHIHLPFQVIKFGPINKISAFPFEGMFKIFRKFFHGTRDLVSQISKNLALENEIFFNQFENFEKLKNKSLKNFTYIIMKSKLSNKFDTKQNFEIIQAEKYDRFDSFVNNFLNLKDQMIKKVPF